MLEVIERDVIDARDLDAHEKFDFDCTTPHFLVLTLFFLASDHQPAEDTKRQDASACLSVVHRVRGGSRRRCGEQQ